MKFFRFSIAVLLVSVLFQSLIFGRNLTYSRAPADNPLKGFMPYAAQYNNFPYSLEWFYMPLKDVQTDYQTFNWQPLDNKLNEIAGRGHQAVFRIYLDYPDTPYGMPNFLANVPKRSYTDYGNGTNNTSYSPDYENADLQRALANFIQAFGQRYDGDPRIGFVTVGLLGHWGEWHTYPNVAWMASTAVQNQVLDSFDQNFNKTRILLREPKNGTNPSSRNIGFHDDSFAFQTIAPPDWHFWGQMTAAATTDIWKREPIGGEVRPEVQNCMWNDVSCVPAGQEYDLCVTTTHASWMLNQGAFDANLTGTRRDRAVAGAQKLGYEIYIPSVQITSSGYGKPFRANLNLRNTGVAPFYYNWTVEFAALSGTNIVKTWRSGFDLRQIQPSLPDKTINLNRTLKLPLGNYKLLMRVVNPLAGGKSFKFANQTQDQDLSGWLTLDTFAVQ
jgi:hypothetical protein